MNILYLHGLESKLSPRKRLILEQFYGNVHAPDLDYSVNPLQPEAILHALPDVEINVVMGSSMGALNAWYVSELLGRPALLFNPPLARYPYVQPATPYEAKYVKASSFKQILLGGSDQVVDPKETLNFLSQHLQQNELFITIDPRLQHQIPIDHFEEQAKQFFGRLCYDPPRHQK